MVRYTVNGLAYNVERAGAGPPLVLLHGFTGNLETWKPFVPALAARFDTIAIDLPGHGASDAPDDPARYRMPRVVEDLAVLLDRLDAGRAAWLGYSMGGRVALHFAVARPAQVAGLVLEGASPGITGAAARAARVRDDKALAASIERDGVAAFVDRWEALPLFASQACLPATVRRAQRQRRLAASATGMANSLRGMGQGVEPPLHDRLSAMSASTLLLAGALDTKFERLAREMAAVMPHARVEIVPGAGHATHLEAPEHFIGSVVRFLDEVLAMAAGRSSPAVPGPGVDHSPAVVGAPAARNAPATAGGNHEHSDRSIPARLYGKERQ